MWLAFMVGCSLLFDKVACEGRADHAGMVPLTTPPYVRRDYKHRAVRELAKLTGQTEIIRASGLWPNDGQVGTIQGPNAHRAKSRLSQATCLCNRLTGHLKIQEFTLSWDAIEFVCQFVNGPRDETVKTSPKKKRKCVMRGLLNLALRDSEPTSGSPRQGYAHITLVTRLCLL